MSASGVIRGRLALPLGVPKARTQELHDDMRQNHVDVFGLLHVVDWSKDGGSHYANQFSAREATQSYGVSTKAIRVSDGLEDVWELPLPEIPTTRSPG